MADLKINQLDPIIYVSSGSGAAFNALSDADLFIVKMKVRGTAIGDEDRKLTWLELRNSLNLGQYMPTVGGNFTGDITMNNNKAVKAQQVGAGADINLLSLDSSNRVNVGSTTNLTRIYSSSVPQFVDGTGTYNLITAKNLPSPADIGSYNKTEVDNKLATKFDKTGGDVSGDINLTQNASRLYGYTTDGLKASLAYVTAGNSVNFGHSTLHSNIVSNDVPSWTNGSQAYDIITRANLPAPGDINAYSKSEVDAIAAQKLNLSGGEMSGNLTIGLNKSIIVREAANVSRIGLAAVPALSSLQIGDQASSLTVKIKSAQNPTVSVAGGTEYALYHGGNKPTAADLGLSDTVSKAASALQDGSFGIGTSTPHKADAGFLSVNDATQFFVQDGGNTEKRFGAMGAGIHLNYGVVGTGTSAQYRSASLFVDQNNKLISKWSALDSNGSLLSTQTATYFSDTNPPTASQVGAYSKTEADVLYARKGVNADITALNSLTGALKVGADGTDDLHVATVRQLRIATGATAGAIVGVVGGFVGAVMWFNGPRDRVPAGWLPADGQTLKRTDAPDLWSAVAAGSYANVTEALWQNSGDASDPSQQSNATNRGKYSLGDGSTTFRLPDLNGGQTGTIANAFLRGYGTGGDQTKIGSMALDGAPNITGGINTVIPGNLFLGTSGASGALSSNSSPENVANNAWNGNQVSRQTQGVSIDASKSYGGYGRKTTEITPRAAVGIWIIRVSNNFEAANTNFSVNNGAATLPASGTATVGGSWQSVYSVAGAQDHSVSLKSFRNVGGLSSAQLTVTQQAQGSQIFKSSTLAFNADGLLTVPGAGQFGGTVLARQTVEPSDTSVGAYLNTPELRTGFKSRGNIPGVTDFGYVSFYGQEHVGDSFAAIVQLNGYGQNRAWYFKQTGEFLAPGAVIGDTVVGNTTDFSFIANGATSAGSGTYVTRITRAYLNSSQRSETDVYNSGQDIQSRIISYNGSAYNVLWVGAGGSSGDNRGVFQAGGSDIKLKDNVTDSADGASDRIASIRTREFDWKHDGRHDRGWIAQELEKVNKTYVFEENGIKNVSSNAIIADLISTVQDLMAQVAELKAAQS